MESHLSSTPSITKTIREVFGYITRFKDQVFILKIDDDLLETPLFPLLIKDIVLIKNMGIKIILVPGAKRSIDQVLETYGEPTPSHNHIRITSDASLPLVKLGASNVANKLLTLLSENGAHGVSGNWVKARGIGVIDGLDYQNTGRVESIKLSVINGLLNNDLIPIASNIGWSTAGKPYNISSNELAVILAKTIGASKLFFISTRKGIPAIENCRVTNLGVRDTGVFRTLEIGQAEQLLSYHEKQLDNDVKELIGFGLEACSAGVNRVHIIDGTQDGILLEEIFSSTGCGTMLHANIYANIRRAKTEDIPGMLHIMQPYVANGTLIQRTSRDISDKLDSYYVYRVDESLHGCGALTFYSRQSAEIESVIVDAQFSGLGTGKKIVSFLLEKARRKNIKKVFVLTTQSGDFFMNIGFKESSIDVLPPEKKAAYNDDRSSKVLTIEL
ncbi:amino-acid N-acetyltransferase [Fibrobacterota bacterium]